MQQTSKLYKELLAQGAAVETRLVVGERGVLINKRGNAITVGGVRIRVASGGPESGYDERIVASLETTGSVFSGQGPGVGGTQAGELDATLYPTAAAIPRQARLAPYVRLTDGERHSEWIPQGVFFLDTREEEEPDGLKKLRIHGYDAMLRGEQNYPASTLDWPAVDTAVVKEIAGAMGVDVDPRVWEIMDGGYRIPLPTGYSCREVLGYIGCMYAGNWIMSDTGTLLLVPLGGLPKETRLLVDKAGNYITVGGVRIRV